MVLSQWETSAGVACNNDTYRDIEKHVYQAVQFVDIYRWIIDAYVSDFFVSDHTSGLPLSWQLCIQQMDTSQLACLLSVEHDHRRVWPLSLLAFKASAQSFSLNRTPIDEGNPLTRISFLKSQQQNAKHNYKDDAKSQTKVNNTIKDVYNDNYAQQSNKINVRLDSQGNSNDEKENGKLPHKHENGKLPHKHEDGKVPNKQENGKLPHKHENGTLPHKYEDGKLPHKQENGKLPHKHENGKSPHKHENSHSTTKMHANADTNSQQSQDSVLETSLLPVLEAMSSSPMLESRNHGDSTTAKMENTKSITMTNCREKSKTQKFHNIYRKPNVEMENTENITKRNYHDNSEKQKFHNIYRKHVKPKKMHEIELLSQVIADLSRVSTLTSVRRVVDIGAGQGHLSRLLSFKHKLLVTSVEAADSHAPKARKFDREVHLGLHKYNYRVQNSMDESVMVNEHLPSHIVETVENSISCERFIQLVGVATDTTPTSIHTDNLPISNDCVNNRVHDCVQNSYICPVNERTKNETVTSSDNLTTKRFEQHSNSCDLKESHPSVESADKLVNPTRRFDSPCIVDDSRKQHDSCSYVQIHSNTSPHHASINNLLQETQNHIITHHHSNTKEHFSNITTTSHPCFTITPSSSFILCVDSTKDPTPVTTSPHLTSTVAPTSRFILTGLHACGDLSTTMLRLFVEADECVALASVACCYMKLSDTNRSQSGQDHLCQEYPAQGYPLSRFLRQIPGHQMSFNAYEVACHSVDVYHQRLLDNEPRLKLHAYRAILQRIITQKDPSFVHGQVKMVTKNCHTLPFEKYAATGLSHLNLDPSLSPAQLSQAQTSLDQSNEVIAFNTIRQSLAPVIETIILLDRMLYLKQHGHDSLLVPLFEPKISPRNFVLLAVK